MSASGKGSKKYTGSSGKLKGQATTDPLPIQQITKTQKQQDSLSNSGRAGTPVLRELNEFITQTPSPKFRRREIVSNWSRYEIDDKQDDEENTNIADFNDLLEASKNESKYLADKARVSHTQQHEKSYKFDLSSKSDSLFAIDIFKLSNAFKCIPFNEYFLNDLILSNDANYLTQSLNDFNKLNKVQPNEPTAPQPSSTLLKEKNFDDIEQLKNLTLNQPQAKPRDGVVNKKLAVLEDEPKIENQTIDDWLDDVILD